MKARHRAAKGTKYSYEDHYEDDDYFFSDDDDSYTASQRNRFKQSLLLISRGTSLHF